MLSYEEYLKIYESKLNSSDILKNSYDNLIISLLEDYHVKEACMLNESEFKKFTDDLKREWGFVRSRIVEGKLLEKDITDEKSFSEWATAYLKKAHGDDFDQKIADKTIKGLIDKQKKEKADWGEMVGHLTKKGNSSEKK